MTHIKTREIHSFFNKEEIERIYKSTNSFFIPMSDKQFVPDISGVDYDRMIPNLTFFSNL